MKFQYPITLKDDWVDYYDIEKYCKKLFKDRVDNLTKPIFWESDLYIGKPGETSEAINEIKKIKVGNDIIAGDVIYVYNEDHLLSKIALKTPYDANLEHKLISYYGEEHLYCFSKTPKRYDRIWMTKDCFIKIGKDKDYGDQKHYLYIIIEAFESTSYISYYDDGKKLEENSSFTWEKAKNLTEEKKTSTKKSYTKKKYGDSDVYQGSSKQAADLAAIDAYGANNPDFW